MHCSAKAREILVASLRREVGRLEQNRPAEDERPISTGSPALDSLLPIGGLRPGTLVEYLTSSPGNGAGTLALAAAREACSAGRALMVVEQAGKQAAGRFYPPAAAAWGIDLSAVLVLRPASEADALWTLDQALRCPGVGAVWAACDRLDSRDFRRLQLAAEYGGTLGLLLRPARLRGQPTWADVQWQVTARATFQVPSSKFQVRRSSVSSFGLQAWRLDVELIRCRGAAGGQKMFLELDEAAGIWREVFDEAAHPMPAIARLADPTAARRA